MVAFARVFLCVCVRWGVCVRVLQIRKFSNISPLPLKLSVKNNRILMFRYALLSS